MREFMYKVVAAKTGRMSEKYMEKMMTQPRPTKKNHVKLTNDLFIIEGWLDTIILEMLLLLLKMEINLIVLNMENVYRHINIFDMQYY
jgi:hypothetical protein